MLEKLTLELIKVTVGLKVHRSLIEILIDYPSKRSSCSQQKLNPQHYNLQVVNPYQLFQTRPISTILVDRVTSHV